MIKKELIEKELPQNRYDESWIREFINNYNYRTHYVLALYGLKNTGESVFLNNMIKHVSENYICYEAENTDTMKELEKTIIKDMENGIKIFFITDITEINDFQYLASTLSDDYAHMGAVIILTGNSFDFKIVSYNELFDRITFLHTTYISFWEHYNYVTKEKCPDSYIKYGGLIDKCIYDYNSAISYIGDAITANICNAIKRDTENSFKNLLDIENLNLVMKTLLKIYAGTLSIGNLEKACIIQKIAAQNRNKHINDIVHTLTKETGINIREYDISNLEELLKSLDVISKTGIKKVYLNYTEEDGLQCTGVHCYQHIIQPAIRYRLLEKQTEYIKDKSLKEHILLQIKEEMLKDIILFDLVKKFKADKFINYSKYYIESNEISINSQIRGSHDLTVWESETNTHWTINIKYGYEKSQEIEAFLSDKFINNYYEERYGKRNAAFILYFGKTLPDKENFQYYNIHEFINKIYLYNDFRHFLS